MEPNKFSIKKQKYTNRTLRFPTELLEQLNILASKTNTSLNYVVIQCCNFALENLADENTI